MFQNIYHQWCNSDPVAYCCYKKHRGYLTAKNLHKHECLRKQCSCLRKIDCEFWRAREIFKERKKQRKKEQI